MQGNIFLPDFYLAALFLISSIIFFIIILIRNKKDIMHFFAKNLVYLIPILLIFATVQIFTSHHYRFYTDETDSIEAAKNIITHGAPLTCSYNFNLVENCNVFYKMFGFPIIQSIAFYIFGSGSNVAIGISMFFAVCTIIIFFALIKHLLDKKYAILLTVILSIFPLFNKWSATSLDMTAYLFFGLLTIFFAIEYADKKDEMFLIGYLLTLFTCVNVRIEGILLSVPLIFYKEMRERIFDFRTAFSPRDLKIRIPIILFLISLSFSIYRYVFKGLGRYDFLSYVNIRYAIVLSLIMVLASIYLIVNQTTRKGKKKIKADRREHSSARMKPGNNSKHIAMMICILLVQVLLFLIIMFNPTSFNAERKLMLIFLLTMILAGKAISCINRKAVTGICFVIVMILCIYGLSRTAESNTIKAQHIMVEEINDLELNHSCYLISGFPSIWNADTDFRVIDLNGMAYRKPTMQYTGNCFYLARDVGAYYYRRDMYQFLQQRSIQNIYALNSTQKGFEKKFIYSLDEINMTDLDFDRHYTSWVSSDDDGIKVIFRNSGNGEFTLGEGFTNSSQFLKELLFSGVISETNHKKDEDIIRDITPDGKISFSINEYSHRTIYYSLENPIKWSRDNPYSSFNNGAGAIESVFLFPKAVSDKDMKKYFVHFDEPVFNSIKGYGNDFTFDRESLFDSYFVFGDTGRCEKHSGNFTLMILYGKSQVNHTFCKDIFSIFDQNYAAFGKPMKAYGLYAIGIFNGSSFSSYRSGFFTDNSNESYAVRELSRLWTQE